MTPENIPNTVLECARSLPRSHNDRTPRCQERVPQGSSLPVSVCSPVFFIIGVLPQRRSGEILVLVVILITCGLYHALKEISAHQFPIYLDYDNLYKALWHWLFKKLSYLL